jgi:hypothetical protein
MNEALLRAMGRLLLALAALALEHDKGYASKATWWLVKQAMDALDSELKR